MSIQLSVKDGDRAGAEEDTGSDYTSRKVSNLLPCTSTIVATAPPALCTGGAGSHHSSEEGSAGSEGAD